MKCGPDVSDVGRNSVCSAWTLSVHNVLTDRRYRCVKSAYHRLLESIVRLYVYESGWRVED
jgi:hypothetical protein